jgi:hypothetical protein
MTTKKDGVHPYFGELHTAHVYAYYKKGEFYDFDTGEKVKLEEREPVEPFDKEKPNGIFVKIIVPLFRTTDEDYEKHKKLERKQLLSTHTKLQFYMGVYGRGRVRFEVVIKSDLTASKKGNKEWKLDNCPCQLIGAEERYEQGYLDFDFEPIEAMSLNQLFTQISIRFRPENISHNCNVFKTFRVANTGMLLDNLRNTIDSLTFEEL